MSQAQQAPPVAGGVEDWRGEYAYTAGVQAFIYGFPYIHNAKLRHDWVTQARDPAVIPYAAVNEFWHAARLMDATYRDGGCPSNDALYSLAWLDLRDEPVILSHPDMADRYFTFELTGFGSDNFGYVGQRTTGSQAGHFAITGPGWKGDLPPEVQLVGPAPTPVGPGPGPHPGRRRRGFAGRAGAAGAVPAYAAEHVGQAPGGNAGTP